DDLELIAIRQQRIGMRAARHDLAVALHRHLLSGEVQRGEQGGDLDRPLEAVRLAVDRDLDHRDSTTRYSPSITRLRALRVRHQSQPQVIAPAVKARATRSDAKTNVSATKTRASMADRMRWIMAAIMPRAGTR